MKLNAVAGIVFPVDRRRYRLVDDFDALADGTPAAAGHVLHAADRARLGVLIFWIIFFEIAVLYFASSTLLRSRLAAPRWRGSGLR